MKPITFLREIVAAPPDTCVLWPFAMSSASGYGRVKWQGRLQNAHRVALILHTGHDPGPDIHALHAPRDICSSRLCVNPLHARWGSASENMADKVVDGTSNRGEQGGLAKLRAADIPMIRQDTRPWSVIARHYGVSKSTIQCVVERRTWAHI